MVVDFLSYRQHGPSFVEYAPIGELVFSEDGDDTCTCGTCSSNEKLKHSQKMHYDRAKATDEWEGTQFLICPPRVLGYHLKGKKWVELDVDKVADIAKIKDRSSFQSLELKQSQKTLIEQLVSGHASGATGKDRSMKDLTAGKGNGLVILLHGKSLSYRSQSQVTKLCKGQPVT